MESMESGFSPVAVAAPRCPSTRALDANARLISSQTIGEFLANCACQDGRAQCGQAGELFFGHTARAIDEQLLEFASQMHPPGQTRIERVGPTYPNLPHTHWSRVRFAVNEALNCPLPHPLSASPFLIHTALPVDGSPTMRAPASERTQSLPCGCDRHLEADEVNRLAKSEGLVLQVANGGTGFRNVSQDKRRAAAGGSHPFSAQLEQNGIRMYIGSFASAPEAALAIARYRRATGMDQASRAKASRAKASTATAAKANAATLSRAETDAAQVGSSEMGKAQVNVAELSATEMSTSEVSEERANAVRESAAQTTGIVEQPDIDFLRCSFSKTGFLGVSRRVRGETHTYVAQVPKAFSGAEKPKYVGTFQTASDAARAISREMEPEKAASAAASKLVAHHKSLRFLDIHALSDADAERMADAQGLRRDPGGKISSTSGFKNARKRSDGRYYAMATKTTNKKQVKTFLGTFGSAAKAALAAATHIVEGHPEPTHDVMEVDAHAEPCILANEPCFYL